MANHRELAHVVYATTLGRESASRIWRTVVVAGAMLGAPLTATAGDRAPPPAKPEKAPAQSRPAPPPPRPLTKAELAKQANDRVTTLTNQIADLDAKIKATRTGIKTAKDQAARDTANATLAQQQERRSRLEAQRTQAKADAKKADAAAKAEANANKPKPKPRPRANDDRPVGRGFILG